MCYKNGKNATATRRGSKIINEEDVRVVEKKVKELRQMAVIAGNKWRISILHEKEQKIAEEQNIQNDGLHHVRPSLSAFFSGRPKELNTLRVVLEKWGSAVITQYGGVGKTELMIALADRKEQ